MKRMNLLAGAWMVLLLAACSNDDTALDSIADTPITFQVGMAEATTRAEGTPLASGSMGFYMRTPGTTDPRYTGDNREVVCTNGKGTLVDKPLLWQDKSKTISWYAYYPYTDTGIDDGIMTVNIPANQNAETVSDFLYVQGTATEGGVIDIQLEHMLSKLIINLTPGTVLGNDVTFESVVLTGMKTQDKFNLAKDGLQILIGNFMFDPNNYLDINMIKHTDGVTFEAVLLPGLSRDINVDITLEGGKKFYYKRKSYHFQRGKIHTLNLQVGENSEDNNTITSATWKQEEWPIGYLYPIQQPTIKLQP